MLELCRHKRVAVIDFSISVSYTQGHRLLTCTGSVIHLWRTNLRPFSRKSRHLQDLQTCSSFSDVSYQTFIDEKVQPLTYYKLTIRHPSSSCNYFISQKWYHIFDSYRSFFISRHNRIRLQCQNFAMSTVMVVKGTAWWHIFQLVGGLVSSVFQSCSQVVRRDVCYLSLLLCGTKKL